MGDVFEAMLRGALDSLDRGDRKRVTETARMDKVLDRLDTAIKKYLTSLDSDALDDADHRRLSEILAFTTNLEHAGDIVEKSLMPLATKRIKHGLSFSEASRQEIRQMMDRLIGNARAAAAVFMTEDPRAARRLLGEKEAFRELELRATEEYFGRPRAGRAENIGDGQAPPRHRARFEAGECASRRRGVPDPRRPRRVAPDPPQAGRLWRAGGRRR